MDFEIEFEELKETYEIECKAAQGRDGQGELPKDFWESYSAMANTDGGSIFLGVAERDGQFTRSGIKQPDKVIKELVDTVNNREKVSVNLVSNDNIVLHNEHGVVFIEVKVPRATRKERPVHLKRTPIGNSYRRLHEADQRMSEDAVKRMLADQQYDSLDDRVLQGFGIEDLDEQSFREFRQAIAVRQPDADFASLDDEAFLKRLRMFRTDRETGVSGLTAAGLLFLGRYETIRDEFSHYFPDYQLRDGGGDGRYSDRICPDASWSGNLYDFYRRVYPRLVRELKVGFQLKDGVRENESPAHVAIREALVNAIVHADYAVSAPLTIIQGVDYFSFSNPGSSRIPLDQLSEGGLSDSRNKNLQDLFRLIGAGERQGLAFLKSAKIGDVQTGVLQPGSRKQTPSPVLLSG